MAVAATAIVPLAEEFARRGLRKTEQVVMKPVIQSKKRTVVRYTYDRNSRPTKVEEIVYPVRQLTVGGLVLAGVAGVVIIGIAAAATGRIQTPHLPSLRSHTPSPAWIFAPIGGGWLWGK